MSDTEPYPYGNSGTTPDHLAPAVDPWSDGAATEPVLPQQQGGAWVVVPEARVDMTRTVSQPPAPPQPTGRKRYVILPLVIVLIAAAAVAYGLTKNSPKTGAAPGASSTVTGPASAGVTSASGGTAPAAVVTTPSPSTGPTSTASCLVGTWIEQSATWTITDSQKSFGVGTGRVTLTLSSPSETRVFASNGTGTITVGGDIYTGTASDGTSVSIELASSGTGTFAYTVSNDELDYTDVNVPGRDTVTVAGQSAHSSEQIFGTGTANITCSGTTMTQSDLTYSRTYTRTNSS